MDEQVLSSILDIAHKKFCRFPLVLSGEKSWCLQTLQSSLSSDDLDQSTFVSSQANLEGFHTIPANKVKTLLGGECRLLVWDGFSGFNPDALGAASGLVKGGGLVIFIVPPLDQLPKAPDPDYIRMCTNECELSQTNTYFLERLVNFFNQKECLLFEQGSHSSPALPDLVEQINEQQLPTTDQGNAIDAIIHVVEGHRRRPLVITADRGRGKSSALGIAAARLVLKYKKNILLSAPSKQACTQAFHHYSETITSQGLVAEDYQQYLQFVSPDELLINKPVCQILMVDEAAGIPAPLLDELLDHYSRIVFSTTIHGYEGNGQGFAIRFKKQLDLKTPNWKSTHLNQAVRWADNDPLENWISKLLFLSLDDRAFSNSRVIRKVCSEFSIEWFSQEKLAKQSGLLEQIISLLVNAHYQTSPDDIRMILDHPGVHVACGIVKETSNDKVSELSSAMLLIEEGQINDPELQSDILAGQRRLRGHLVPQSLATVSGDKTNLSFSSLRVMRIAVRPEYENQGMGSQLIKTAYQYAEKRGIDYFSTAFGLTPELLYFWQKNQFCLVKLGIQRDSASGCHSAIMLRPISKSAQAQTVQLQAMFAKQLEVGSSRQFRQHSAIALLNAIKAARFSDEQVKLNGRELTQIKRFSETNLAIENCMSELVKLLFCYFSKSNDKYSDLLEQESQLLLVRRIIQAHSISRCAREFNLIGKKELDKKLRKAVMTLLKNITKY